MKLKTRAVSTTRFVKISKKETVTPYSNNISKVKVSKEAEKPVLRDVEPVVKEAIAEKPVIKEIVSTQQQFPTTKEFDTPSEEPQEVGHNWSSSFFGLSTEKFPKEVADILLEPISADDIEIKPGKDVLINEIKDED